MGFYEKNYTERPWRYYKNFCFMLSKNTDISQYKLKISEQYKIDPDTINVDYNDQMVVLWL